MNITEELKMLRDTKIRWFENAVSSGIINQLYFIGRNLGNYQTTTYGPKYKYSDTTIEIFVDDYGHYMTVHFNKELVCSTHYCQKLYVQGDWEDVIENLHKEALVKSQVRKEQRELVEIEELKRNLGMK